MASFQSSDGVMIRFEVLGDGPPVFVCHGGPNNICDTLIKDLAPLQDNCMLVFHDYRGSGQSGTAPVEYVPSLIAWPTTSTSFDSTSVTSRYRCLRTRWADSWLSSSCCDTPKPRRVSPSSAPRRAAQQSPWRSPCSERWGCCDRPRPSPWRPASSSSGAGGQPARPATRRCTPRCRSPRKRDASCEPPSKMAHPEVPVENDNASHLMKVLGAIDLRAEVATIACPVLVLYGTRDAVMVAGGQMLRAALPSSELCVLPDVGHEPFIEAALRDHGDASPVSHRDDGGVSPIRGLPWRVALCGRCRQ